MNDNRYTVFGPGLGHIPSCAGLVSYGNAMHVADNTTGRPVASFAVEYKEFAFEMCDRLNVRELSVAALKEQATKPVESVQRDVLTGRVINDD